MAGLTYLFMRWVNHEYTKLKVGLSNIKISILHKNKVFKVNWNKVTGFPNSLLKLQLIERSALERYATNVSNATT